MQACSPERPVDARILLAPLAILSGRGRFLPTGGACDEAMGHPAARSARDREKTDDGELQCIPVGGARDAACVVIPPPGD